MIVPQNGPQCRCGHAIRSLCAQFHRRAARPLLPCFRLGVSLLQLTESLPCSSGTSWEEEVPLPSCITAESWRSGNEDGLNRFISRHAAWWKSLIVFFLGSSQWLQLGKNSFIIKIHCVDVGDFLLFILWCLCFSFFYFFLFL
jgi:hypothetical protein